MAKSNEVNQNNLGNINWGKRIASSTRNNLRAAREIKRQQFGDTPHRRRPNERDAFVPRGDGIEHDRRDDVRSRDLRGVEGDSGIVDPTRDFARSDGELNATRRAVHDTALGRAATLCVKVMRVLMEARSKDEDTTAERDLVIQCAFLCVGPYLGRTPTSMEATAKMLVRERRGSDRRFQSLSTATVQRALAKAQRALSADLDEDIPVVVWRDAVALALDAIDFSPE